jgi:glycerol uptake facilitator-like aquaporin
VTISANQTKPESAVVLHGEQALIASVGGARCFADWTNPRHRLRRLIAEFIGMSGLTFVLSGGAAILALYGGGPVSAWEAAFVLSAVSALWLVVAVYFLGDISAHFNPAMTFAFVLRGDMGWPMAGVYVVVQLVAAAAGSLLARVFFGVEGNLAATVPQLGQFWQAIAFEAVITFGLVLMVLSMTNGPKLNGPFRPAGRRCVHHVVGNDGWSVRGRLDEPGTKLWA